MPIDRVESAGTNRIEKRRESHRSEETKTAEDEKTRLDRDNGQTRATRGVKESGLGENVDLSF